VVKGIERGRAPCYRNRPLTGAVALAGGHAAVSPMGKGLWEVRTDLPGNRTARVLICLYRGCLVALHGFIKKTRATPDDDLTLARRRQKELEQ
jgi:phage-related protein